MGASFTSTLILLRKKLFPCKDLDGNWMRLCRRHIVETLLLNNGVWISEKQLWEPWESSKDFFDLIKLGKKPLEVRVGYDSINRIQVGEHISLETHTAMLEVRVSDIRRYRTFEEMLKKEQWELISPDSTSEKEVLSLLKRIYPPDKERLGVIVFEFIKFNG